MNYYEIYPISDINQFSLIEVILTKTDRIKEKIKMSYIGLGIVPNEFYSPYSDK